MSKFIYIIDNGHGGVINGVYQTPGKRFVHPDGLTIYEGDFNRKVSALLSYYLSAYNIQHFLVCPELEDTPLQERVKRANSFYAKYKNCIFISIHGNAGGGNGFEVFTSPGETQSDKVATKMVEAWEAIPQFSIRKDTSDGDADKEAKFYVIQETKMPAILTENLFMDTYDNCKYMLSRDGQVAIAKAHFNMIRSVESL